VRQVERISLARLGLSPKAFARVVRFSAAYRLHEERPGLRWTDIAYQCGYFDQMHLIRDFRDFAGMPPGVIERALAQTELRLQANLRL
jgi:AraC-like DNA-binding protein